MHLRLGIRNEVCKRKIHSAPRQASHTLDFDCTDAVHTSSSFEPEARLDGSLKTYEPESGRTENSFETSSLKLYTLSRQKYVKIQLAVDNSHARTGSKFTWEFSDAKRSNERYCVLPSKWQFNPQQRQKRLLGESRCEYIDIRTRKQANRPVEHRGQ